jgi:hypothetical protein
MSRVMRSDMCSKPNSIGMTVKALFVAFAATSEIRTTTCGESGGNQFFVIGQSADWAGRTGGNTAADAISCDSRVSTALTPVQKRWHASCAFRPVLRNGPLGRHTLTRRVLISTRTKLRTSPRVCAK